MPKYTVLSPVKHDGMRHSVDSTITLKADEGAALVALGVLEDPAIDAARAAAEKAEAERLAAEKAAAEQAEAERLAAEKAVAEQAEAERLAAEKAAAEQAKGGKA